MCASKRYLWTGSKQAGRQDYWNCNDSRSLVWVVKRVVGNFFCVLQIIRQHNMMKLQKKDSFDLFTWRYLRTFSLPCCKWTWMCANILKLNHVGLHLLFLFLYFFFLTFKPLIHRMPWICFEIKFRSVLGWEICPSCH